jgi:hypothetical protein
MKGGTQLQHASLRNCTGWVFKLVDPQGEVIGYSVNESGPFKPLIELEETLAKQLKRWVPNKAAIQDNEERPGSVQDQAVEEVHQQTHVSHRLAERQQQGLPLHQEALPQTDEDEDEGDEPQRKRSNFHVSCVRPKLSPYERGCSSARRRSSV